MITIHTFLGGNNFSDDEINAAIELMEDMARIYCNISSITANMKNLILAMAAGFLLSNNSSEKRISIGDMSIENFEKKDEFIPLLNRFRRCFNE